MLLKGGTVYLEDGPLETDVLVRDGAVAGVGRFEEADDVIDATGCAVLPGMIDVHVHADDVIGGVDLADTFLTVSEAAVRTGITTICGFVTQGEQGTLEEALEASLARARKGSYCDYTFHLTPSRFDDEGWERISELSRAGYRTLKLYTTYVEAGLHTDYVSLEAILGRCNEEDLTVLVHCEDQDVLDSVRWNETDLADPYFHTKMRPPEAEVEAIGRVVALARKTGARVHVVHVSTAEGARIIAVARSGCAVTCETGPQYLLLNEDRLKGEKGHRYLCTPPLRSEENRAQLERTAGIFDVFATDHCAYLRRDKDVFGGDLRTVPSGLAGVGALVPAAYGVLRRGGLGLEALVERLSRNPAKLIGAYPRKGVIRKGSDADLAVVRTDGPRRPVHSSLADVYETFPDLTTTLDVRVVLVRGDVVVRDGEVVDPAAGRSILGEA